MGRASLILNVRHMLAERRLGRYTLHFIIAALILVTLVSYLHVFRSGFVFDDTLYLVENRHVQDGFTPDAVKWAFTAFYGANWQPMTWLSSMLDYRIFGSNPAGHHATNLFLHIFNTILLLLVLRRMTGSLWKSAFVAALFALHPLHVESVAWVSERKDVLSTCFMLLAIWAYVRYAERPSLRGYSLVAAAFALGLMAKPMLVSLPILLLLLDYWPLHRASFAGGKPGLSPTKLIREKAPLFALSAASCVITYLAQRSGAAVIQLERFPLGLRVANSLVSYATYIGKTLCPTGLAAYYPYPRTGVPVPVVIVALLVMTAISVFAIRQARPRPYVAVGWLWYVITLVPVIGLVQVGEQSMADRYTYIPLIGLFIMAAWGIPDLLQSMRALGKPKKGEDISIAHLPVLSVSACLVIVALAACTSRQVGFWESNYTLFHRAVSATNGSALVLSNYGIELAKKGDYDKAIEQYREAIKAEPAYVESYVNLGNALKATGHTKEALKQYQEALTFKPDYTDALVSIANIMAEQGQGDAAAGEYSRVLDFNPDDPRAHFSLGYLLAKQGKVDEAVTHFERAIEITPDFDKAHFNLANLLSQRGEIDKAAEHYSEALRINPNYAEAHRGLALILGMQRRPDDAADHLRQAIKIKPNYADAHNDIGILLAQQGRVDEAIAQFSAAVKYRPDFVEAHSNLGLGLASKGNLDAAIAEYEKALKLNPGYLQVHGNLASAFYSAGRYADAWREVRIAERYGMKPPPEFIKALSAKMPRR